MLHQPRIDRRSYDECGTCGVVHPCKVMHLNLDAEGTAIVSVPGWENLQRQPLNAGFTLANEVPNPPTQQLHLPGKPVQSMIEGVDVAGVLAAGLDNNDPIVFDMGGNGSGTTHKATVDLRTVTIEEYFEIMERNGFTSDQAANKLLTAVWDTGTGLKGAQ